jgi:hypothetical protein
MKHSQIGLEYENRHIPTTDSTQTWTELTLSSSSFLSNPLMKAVLPEPVLGVPAFGLQHDHRDQIQWSDFASQQAIQPNVFNEKTVENVVMEPANAAWYNFRTKKI